MLWLWLGFFVLMVGMVLLDILVLRARAQRVTPVASVGHAAVWLFAAMAFNVVVFVLYEGNVLDAGLRDSYTEALSGGEASVQFLSSFIVELAVGVESMFIIGVLFGHFKVPPVFQHRLLLWGILVSMVFRALLILGSGALLHKYEWCRFILTAILLTAALRMVVIRQENLDPDKNLLIRLLRKFVPISPYREGANLLTTVEGRPALTPLIVPLLLMESADAFLALDSIPASFAFTREPFLIFCASGFALLCLRSMAPALTLLLGRLRYFKLGLAMLLAFSAVLLALPISWVQRTIDPQAPLGALPKLGIIAIALLVGVAAAWLLGGGELSAVPTVSPLGQDADRLARQALGRIRKVTIAVLGFTGLAAGVVIGALPGPGGIPIVVVSLLLLATEFVWARTLVKKYRKRAEEATERVARATARRFRPWLLALVMGAITVAGLALGDLTGVHIGLVIGGLLPILAGLAYLAYLAYFRKRVPEEPGANADSPPVPDQHKRSA